MIGIQLYHSLLIALLVRHFDFSQAADDNRTLIEYSHQMIRSSCDSDPVFYRFSLVKGTVSIDSKFLFATSGPLPTSVDKQLPLTGYRFCRQSQSTEDQSGGQLSISIRDTTCTGNHQRILHIHYYHSTRFRTSSSRYSSQ